MGWETFVVALGLEFADKFKKELWAKIKISLRKKRKAVLFGCAGVGKSQFVASLQRSFERVKPTYYSKTSRLLLDEFPIILVDTPGHSSLTEIRKEEMEKVILEQKEVIINVVSYGYHERKEIENINDIFNGEQFSSKFLQENRQEELRHLVQMKTKLQLSEVKWFITIIAKADIWWEEKVTVDAYYQTGRYAQEMEKIAEKCNFKHIIIPYCSIITPFYGIKTSGKFGEETKYAMQAHFLETLFDILGKKH